MTPEEIRAARDMAMVKISASHARLAAVVASENARMVSKAKSIFDKHVKDFEDYHTQYVCKIKGKFTDAEHAQEYAKVQTVVSEVEDVMDKYEENLREQDVDKEKKQLVIKFEAEVERVFGILHSVEEEVEINVSSAITEELAYLEKQFYAASEVLTLYYALETEEDKKAMIRSKFCASEKEFRQMLRRIKSKKGDEVSSQGQSISRSVSPAQSGSNVLKTKRMEFPSFDGNIRAYITFRRDFKEIVENSGDFTKPQMAQILRNECLRLSPKMLVSNVYDYEDIWRKLNEAYYNPKGVVEIITRELQTVKNIEEDDFAAFIEFVDKIEKAHLDLSALGQLRVLDHPITVSLILEKVPVSVMKEVAEKLDEDYDNSESCEFSIILNILLEKRRQARRVAGWVKTENKKKPTTNFSKTAKTVQGQARSLVAQAGDDASTRDSGGFKKQKQDYTCITKDCKYKAKHILSDCRAFRRLPVGDRAKLVSQKKICQLCLIPAHDAEDCPKRAVWKPCGVDGCNKWHNRLLHVSSTDAVALVAAGSSAVASDVVLLVQEISISGGLVCNTFWDTGSTVSLVTFKFAEAAGLCGVDCRLDLGGVGDKRTVIETFLYTVDLEDVHGRIHRVFAFGIEQITSKVPGFCIPDVGAVFPDHAAARVNHGECDVDLLVGVQEAHIQPVRVATAGKLALFTTSFGTGYVVGGTSDKVVTTASMARSLLIRDGAKTGYTDFFTAESMGVDIPRRCRSCKNCRDCNFKAAQLTFKENQELAAIEDGLELDVVARRWTAQYPCVKDPANLRNNYSQVVSCMKSLEKRLTKNNQLDAFNAQFKEAVDRGVYRELTKAEVDEHVGPVYYVSIVDAYKEGPGVTTPIRLCMNSSLKSGGLSLNDILVKGPSSLNDIFHVMLGFRRYKVGVVIDISKFYQTVLSCQRDQHLRRVVWRYGDTNMEPKIFVTTRVNFGDRPAGCVAQAALRETARLYNHLSPEAARRICTDTYVDDIVTGADSTEFACELVEKMSQIVSMGGFVLKEKIVSGQELMDGRPSKVLGTLWDSRSDLLSVDVHVNFSQKCKGVRKERNVDLNYCIGADVKLTKRLVWRVVLSQFDLLGLLSVFLVKFKLILRKLSAEGEEKLGWDQPIPESVAEEFKKLLLELEPAMKLMFPRAVVPEFSVGKLRLVAFGDGSQVACCALVYICWEDSVGNHFCRLAAGKTRVAPLRKISVPRVELLGALLATRLMNRVQEVLGFEVYERFFLTDSSAVLGMVQSESSAMKEFVGTRVGEIKTKSDVAKEWYWVATSENLADMGTRDTVVPGDLGLNSNYQCGTQWMRGKRENWPIRRSFGTVPVEEVVGVGTVAVVRSNREVDLWDISTWERLVSVTMYLYAWIWRVRSGTAGMRRPVQEFFTTRNKKLVTNKILQLVQLQSDTKVENPKYGSLSPFQVEVPTVFAPVPLVVVSGRLGKALSVGYDAEFLPLISSTHTVAKLIVSHAHRFDHSGTDRTVQRSRRTAWIPQARKLAKSVVCNCFTCKRLNKVLQKQKMAPLPPHRIPPAPVFGSCAVDLFGPIKVRDGVKRRVTKDAYGVVFVCTYTSAIHLDATEDYSADSFLMCLRRFVSLRGMPTRFQSDPGTQIVAAAKQVRSWAQERCVEWEVIPGDSQHFNGCAEAMVKATKRQLERVTSGLTFTFAELTTLLQEVAGILNSRPLMRSANQDVFAGQMLTPNHLILGRASVEVPNVVCDQDAGLTKRMRFIQSVRDEFWKKWFLQVFPHLVPSFRWKKEQRNVRPGDVVLLKDASLLSKKFKMGIVSECKEGKDGRVRSIKVKYKNEDKKSFTEVERSIHNVVVVVPVDWDKGDAEKAVQEDVCRLHHSALGGV